MPEEKRGGLNLTRVRRHSVYKEAEKIANIFIYK
jgi:hypothetical protein